jgi:hypothetical protein
MAQSFLVSSHRQWLLKAKSTAMQEKMHALDLQVIADSDLKHNNILLVEIMHKIAKKLGFRQRIICTAVVFFKRFYLT